MIIQYQPEGGELQRLDAGRLRASEIQIIERTADGRWAEIKEAMGEGDINALRTVAWALLRRSQPSLRYGEFDPWEGELRARLDKREVAAYAHRILEAYRDQPEDLAEAFDELRGAADDPETAEAAIADVTDPKGQDTPEPEPEPTASPTGG
ncbi:hypothetical protein AB0G76_36990 [Streptomyces asoensis]|uniref:hypothetical protein n=1 Tax=Streptomyces asoensis TaxID=249586 RepID=UPI0033D5183B